MHNGSSLFTGDAGQGESNIRRWIIENDWLEAIVALPLNMFYNTGIATYVWVLTNRKPEHRRGKVQLIDATKWFKPLRKNLGKKNCELVRRRHRAHLRDVPRVRGDASSRRSSRTQHFGYWKVTVERPLRLRGVEPGRVYSREGDQGAEGDGRARRGRAAGDPEGPQAVRAPDPLHGLFETTDRRQDGVVEYEPDPDLRDTEQVPLLEEGGVEAFLEREVLPYAPDAWYDPASIKIGYEISFTREFYKPQPLRTLDEIRADILALEQETKGLLGEIVGAVSA